MTGEGALFLQINRNKLGLTLDPMMPEGQEVVRKLVATADVVIANLPLQTLKAMQLDYDSLKAVKPDIILTTVIRLRQRRPLQQSRRLRRHRPGHVGRRLHDGHRGPALSRAGALGGFRHRAALRVRHHGGADGAQGDRQGPMGAGRAARHRRDLRQRAADRAGGDPGQPRARPATAARPQARSTSTAPGTAGSCARSSAIRCSSAGPS